MFLRNRSNYRSPHSFRTSRTSRAATWRMRATLAIIRERQIVRELIMGRAVQFIAAVTLVVASACSPSDAPAALPTEASVVGHYGLTLVNGGNLPFPIAGDTTRVLAIIDGQLLINSDHTFLDILSTRLTYFSGTPVPSTHADTATGTFVLVGSLIVRTHPGVGIDTVAVTGNLLHANNGGLLLTYAK